MGAAISKHEAHAMNMTIKEAAAATGRSVRTLTTWECKTGLKFLRDVDVVEADYAPGLYDMPEHERARYLEEILEFYLGNLPDDFTDMGLKLTRSEAAIFGLLLKRKGNVVSEAALESAQGHAIGRTELPITKSIPVLLVRLRHKMAAADIGMEITNVHGVGYKMTNCP